MLTPRPRTLLPASASVDPDTGQVYISGSNGLLVPMTPKVFPRYPTIALIGDSRVRYGRRYWRHIISTSGGSIQADIEGIVGHNVASGVAGTLVYNFAANTLQWTAPSDSAGPAVPVQIGLMRLESGSINKALQLGVRQNPPASSNQTITCNTSGSTTWGSKMDCVANWALAYLGWRFQDVINLGIGALSSVDLTSAMLQWYALQADGPGFDLIQVGTNDVTAAAETIAVIWPRIEALLDDRIGRGRFLFVLGEHARDSTAAGGTQMSATQLGLLTDLNRLYRRYCHANAANARYIDLMEISRDPTAATLRPATGVLQDGVHAAVQGAQRMGLVVANVMSATGLLPAAPNEDVGRITNFVPAAARGIVGTGGTASTGGSGTVPTGWTIGRDSGADITIASAIVAKPDGGQMMQLTVNATTGAQIAFATAPTVSLPASAGAVSVDVGSTVRVRARLKFSNITANVTDIQILAEFGNSFFARAGNNLFGPLDDSIANGIWIDSGPVPIPPGSTTIRTRLWINTNGVVTNAVVTVAEWEIDRHPVI